MLEIRAQCSIFLPDVQLVPDIRSMDMRHIDAAQLGIISTPARPFFVLSSLSGHRGPEMSYLSLQGPGSVLFVNISYTFWIFKHIYD